MTETSPSFDAACTSAQKALHAIDAAHAEIAAEARLSEENRVIAILQSMATRNGVVPPIDSIAVPPSQINSTARVQRARSASPTPAQS